MFSPVECIVFSKPGRSRQPPCVQRQEMSDEQFFPWPRSQFRRDVHSAPGWCVNLKSKTAALRVPRSPLNSTCRKPLVIDVQVPLVHRPSKPKGHSRDFGRFTKADTLQQNAKYKKEIHTRVGKIKAQDATCAYRVDDNRPSGGTEFLQSSRGLDVGNQIGPCAWRQRRH